MYDWHNKTGRAYVTSGIGYGKTELSAFDAAELDAKILSTNAIKVSSFVPPNWPIINNKEQLKKFTDNGVFLPMAYAQAISNKDSVAASLLIGINSDANKPSIIIEHADVNISKEDSLEESSICIKEVFASREWTFDSIEKVSVGGLPKDGRYVCALVAVVFVID